MLYTGSNKQIVLPIRDYAIMEIVKESQKRIKKALVQGFEYDHLVIVRSDEFLRQHDSQKMDFPVIYVDLVGSTMMSTELSPDQLSRIITVFSHEISFVIEHFGGYVLKFLGDAVIGYFPMSDTIPIRGSRINSAGNEFDKIIQCSDAIIQVTRNAINPLLLVQEHYKGIKVKVTADYGRHTIVRYGSDRERSHIDIISATLNIAAKMQPLSRAWEMVIGDQLYIRLSDRSRASFAKRVVNDHEWNYHYFTDRKPYEIYVANF